MENIKQPEMFVYIASRLSGRPLDAYLWFLWVLGLSAASLIELDANHDGQFTDRVVYSIVLLAFNILVLVACLVFALARQKGREWLISKSPGLEMKNGDASSRFAVRGIPVLGLIVLVEYVIYYS